MEALRRMLTAKEVADRLGVSRTTAYTVIRELNEEMTRRGCKVIPGRVSNEYFEAVYFGDRSKAGECTDVR